jgi:hypothetical protein
VTDDTGPVWESHAWCVGGSVTGSARCGGEGASAHGRGMGEATRGSEGFRISAVRLMISLDPRSLQLALAEDGLNLLQGPVLVDS